MFFFLSLVCGALLPFAFAPYNQLALAGLGLAGWLWLLLQQPQHAFKLGWFFGFGWFGLGSWWLADTLQTYGHLPYATALLAITVLGLVLGLFFACWAWIVVKLQRQTSDLLWLFPIIGVLEEWLRSFLFTGLPWTAIGNLALQTPAASWISIIGSYGVTLLLLLSISSLVLLLQHKTYQYGVVGSCICAALFFLAPTIDIPKHPQYKVALVQPNIPQNKKWDAAFVRETMFRLLHLSEQAGRVDLIIWPEAAVPFFLSPEHRRSIWLQTQMAHLYTPIIFGGLKHHNVALQTIQNGLFLNQNEMPQQFVGKQHLVPFGEYVPAWLPWLGKLVPDIGHFQPASDKGILTLGDQKFGSIICYESIFPAEAAARVQQGATALIVVTNDAWYDHSPAAWQHFQASQVRAIETGRYVLRATNTGISAIISPDGKVQQSIPWWQEAVVIGQYQPLTHITLYQQWGDMPILCIIFLGIGLSIIRLYISPYRSIQ